MSLFLIWSSIQSIKELIRVKTEYVLPAGHFGIPQLTAPLKTNFPSSEQTSGPPLSPLQPLTMLFPPKPAQTIDSSSTGWKKEFPFEQLKWLVMGIWACCNFPALSVDPGLLAPQPRGKKQTNNKVVTCRNSPFILLFFARAVKGFNGAHTCLA